MGGEKGCPGRCHPPTHTHTHACVHACIHRYTCACIHTLHLPLLSRELVEGVSAMQGTKASLFRLLGQVVLSGCPVDYLCVSAPIIQLL